MKIFTVYDSKAAAYLLPFYSENQQTAIRSFEGAVNDPDHQFNKFPQDFNLFELGSWNQSTAKFKLHKAPVHLGLAIEYKTNPIAQNISLVQEN